MELIPAIDLLGRRSVRLRGGDFDRQVVSGTEPAGLARGWAAAGVAALHVVDLDGARVGQPQQLELLAEVAAAARRAAPSIRIQAGGGLRSRDAVAAVLDAGVDVAVIGTAALERPGFMAECATRWPGRVIAALDLRDGQPAVDGWLRSTAEVPLASARRLLDEGASTLVITDTRRDGMLAGPNLDLLASFRAALPGARLVAAGGVRSISDLIALRRAGLDGAIVGMALMAGRLDVHRALARLAHPVGAS